MCKQNRGFKAIMRIAILIVLCFVIIGGYKVYTQRVCENNHKLITRFLNEEFAFREEEMEDGIKTMKDFVNRKHVYDVDRGWLYERLAYTYQQMGDSVLYYDAIGKALYYLRQGADIDYITNITTDLANFYLTHNESKMAQAALDDLYKQINVDNLTKSQIKSYLYRVQGILDVKYERFDQGYENLMKAKEFIYKDENSKYYGPAYEAMTDIALAEYYYSTRQFEECRKIIDQYEDSEFFEVSEYADAMARGFIIPYYVTAIKITVYDKQIERTDKFLHAFIDACHEYHYLNIELELLDYLMAYLPNDNEEYQQEFDREIRSCYKTISDDLYKNQASLMNRQIGVTMDNELKRNQEEKERLQRVHEVVLAIFIAVMVIYVLVSFIIQSGKDALTHIGNRRSLNRILNHYNTRNQIYSIIMIDIDNFKSINDTYGHEMGDEVLVRLGQILNSERTREVYPFRYGGEEFLVMVKGSNYEYAKGKAEHIRKVMEKQKWDGIDRGITISLGVAIRQKNESDVVKRADENLYYSKEHGKNVVTYTEDGMQMMLK